MLRHSSSNRHSLRAGADGIRCVFHIRALHDRASGEKQGAADVEFRIRAFEIMCRQQRRFLYPILKTVSSYRNGKRGFLQ